MRFRRTNVPGVTLVELERMEDERGFFARSYCAEEFAENGLAASFVQGSVSYNRHRHTLRGMHYQDAPAPEPKLVRCTRGAIFDVALDLRRDSPAYCRWVGFELTQSNHRTLYVPPGCAHGFLTLDDEAEVHYLMGAAYHPELARGVRWDDPVFGIRWPRWPSVISERDAHYADFVP